MTTSWNLFLESFESGSREWSNSLHEDALQQLEGEERERATQLLLAELKRGSPRVSRALACLPEPRVREALRAHLEVATGPDRIATAFALLQMEPWPEATRAIEAGLLDSDLTTSMEALRAMEKRIRSLGSEALDPLLAAAATNPNSTIRVGVAMLVLYLAGLNEAPDSDEHPDILDGLDSDECSERQWAFAELCKRMGIDDQYEGPRP